MQRPEDLLSLTIGSLITCDHTSDAKSTFSQLMSLDHLLSCIACHAGGEAYHFGLKRPSFRESHDWTNTWDIEWAATVLTVQSEKQIMNHTCMSRARFNNRHAFMSMSCMIQPRIVEFWVARSTQPLLMPSTSKSLRYSNAKVAIEWWQMA